MKKSIFHFSLFILLSSFVKVKAQAQVKIVDGIIYLGDVDFVRNEKKYYKFTDSLDKNLNLHPNDTTSLFYRALLYLRYNNFVVNPDLSSNQATTKLLIAKKMADRADSLKMQSLYIKVLRAQLCKELATRYAPIEIWRFNEKQMTERKKKFDYYKGLANSYYDGLAVLDKRNAYDYQRLKVK